MQNKSWKSHQRQVEAPENAKINMILGNLIRLQRVNSGITLKDLSDTSGVSLSHLSRIERGKAFPSQNVLHRVVELLGGRQIYLKVVDLVQ